MSGWNILHVSDFHITDPSDTEGREYLRKGKYVSFLDDMIAGIDAGREGEIDSIVATGDFVDKGRVANFPHAKSIIEHLSAKVGIATAEIPICIGNHDLVRADEENGRELEARKAYGDFSGGFLNARGKTLGQRGVLCGPSPEGVHFLMLDSTLGAKGKERAGSLLGSEIDELLAAIETVPTDALLVVASHHVIGSELVASIAPPFEGNEDWTERHVWRSSRALWRSLRERRKSGPVLWLSGDVHYPCYHSYEGHHYVVSGRLGEPVSFRPMAEVPRQVSVIRVPKAVGVVSRVRVAEFHRDPDVGGAFTGKWGLRDQEAVVTQRQSWPSTVDTCATSQSETVTRTPFLSQPAVEIFDKGAQSQIEEAIAARGLYRFGRFATSDGDVSLSWISIGPLLKENKILPTVVGEMVKWLKREILSTDAPGTAILIGIDCWGAVLASQVSVRTGIDCVCTGVRGRGRYHLPQETLDARSVAKIANRKTVVVVSDVISTGDSVQHVQAKVAEQSGRLEKGQDWVAFSVLCDEEPNQPRNCAGVLRLITACGSVRMPRLPTTFLPNTTILPPTIAF